LNAPPPILQLSQTPPLRPIWFVRQADFVADNDVDDETTTDTKNITDTTDINFNETSTNEKIILNIDDDTANSTDSPTNQTMTTDSYWATWRPPVKQARAGRQRSVGQSLHRNPDCCFIECLSAVRFC
jgi:hypothetical protein